MIVGVVSDTHGYYHPELDNAFANVDHIFHAGDVGNLEIIDRLSLLAPTSAVWGNIDGAAVRRETPEYQRVVLDGVQFLMTHIAGKPGKIRPDPAKKIAQHRPDVFICGHSHILQVDRLNIANRPLFVNPGAAGQQGLHRIKTCVRLMLKDGNLSNAEVIHLDGD
ncbi:MAG: metallophosphoesterase family protein [Rhodothermales bacterium]|nr:metallophosphoesterase family protein [Rhodothermales bacterium]